jgi:hypothetical protein
MTTRLTWCDRFQPIVRVQQGVGDVYVGNPTGRRRQPLEASAMRRRAVAGRSRESFASFPEKAGEPNHRASFVKPGRLTRLPPLHIEGCLFFRCKSRRTGIFPLALPHKF